MYQVPRKMYNVIQHGTWYVVHRPFLHWYQFTCQFTDLII